MSTNAKRFETLFDCVIIKRQEGNKMQKKYFVIEGTDGSGKKTQADLLVSYLRKNGWKASIKSFPNYYSQSSGPVKMYLSGELCEKADEMDAFSASALFAVDRLCTMKILEKQDDEILVLDRYMESNLVHQGSKIKSDEELKKYVDWAVDFEFTKLKIPRPDVVLFLNVPPETSMKLAEERLAYKSGASNDIHEKDREHIQNAHKTGLKLAKMLGWKIVDCTDENGKMKSIEEIHGKIVAQISNYL